jgi:6-phosphofructokinase 1
VIRAVAKAASRRGWSSVGFLGGYEGMLPPIRTRELDVRELGGLLVRGGTVLGTSNHGRFRAKHELGQVRRIPDHVLQAAKRTFEEMELRALVCIGGDGSLTIAQQLHETGVRLVGVPKTIDNDVNATLLTFGFDSAVACAVEALDRLHSTAESHNRVMVLEVMGRYAGWIAATAGIAGGADIILIPEIPFDYDAVAEKVRERETEGKLFTIAIVAEGAHEQGGSYVTNPLSPTAQGEPRLGGIGARLAAEIERRTGKESRAVVLGHLQRGGVPTSFDRQLCTRFGVTAVEVVADERYGMMVALTGDGIVPVPLSEAIGRVRTVPPDSDLIRTGHAIGVCFGQA